VMRKQVTSELLNGFFSNFERVFGEQEAVEVDIVAMQAPELSIDESGSTLSCIVQITV